MSFGGGSKFHAQHAPGASVRVPIEPIAAWLPLGLTPSVLVACALQISRYFCGAREPNATATAAVPTV